MLTSFRVDLTIVSFSIIKAKPSLFLFELYELKIYDYKSIRGTNSEVLDMFSAKPSKQCYFLDRNSYLNTTNTFYIYNDIDYTPSGM